LDKGETPRGVCRVHNVREGGTKMERITSKDVERIAATVSKGLPGVHTVNPQRRNGYTGLDHYDGPACLETLHVGTAREVYTYLQGMRRVQLIDGGGKGV
jgi:hypothetical protein